MRNSELKRIENLYISAQKGPWKSYIEGRDHTSGSDFIMVGEGNDRLDDIELSGATKADQDFIASARQDIPALVEEIRRLKAKLGEKGSD